MSLETPIQIKKLIEEVFPQASSNAKKREIAYSMDTLVPGVYLWAGSFAIRIWGAAPDDSPYRYPGTLNSRYGVAIVLPGYHILTTYKDSYDPR
jgi:hypothetical protein